MRTAMITTYINEIAASFGGVRPLVNEGPLRALYGRKDFVGMIKHVQSTLGLTMKLRVGFVNSGGPNQAPAWIALPRTMPLYGSKEFSEMLLIMHVRKSFIHERSFESIVACIAHELSHIVLSATHHRLHSSEEAVDLTAMVLGYRNFYRLGCEWKLTRTEGKRPLWESLLFFWEDSYYDEISTTHNLGYLASEEVAFAANTMDRLVRA